MPVEEIDRVYRALFVHSFGVFQMIKEATKKVSVKPKAYAAQGEKQGLMNVLDKEHADSATDSPTLKIKRLEK